MNIFEYEIKHVSEARPLTFGAVQLGSPVVSKELQYVDDEKSWSWTPRGVSRRLAAVNAILANVFSPNSPTGNLDFLIFPEYSIPKRAIKEVEFQRYADANNVVIAAGSYFEDDARNKDYYRRNIATLFIPNWEKPISYGKFTAAPEEKGVLASASNLPNIIRLYWSPDGRGNKVAISFFLCRDYLSPFKATEITMNGSEQRVHISLLDWQHSGINIVQMHNEDPRLFEGVASLDIRELHSDIAGTESSSKLVLFANCATGKGQYGTALIGPTVKPALANRDVAACLKSSDHGLLRFEANLWNIEVTKKTPDSRIAYPIQASQLFKFNDNFEMLPLREDQVAKNFRAVWHPALLEVLNKSIVFDFYKSNSIMNVRKAFVDGDIRFVKAGYLRGEADVLIRRYTSINIAEDDVDFPLAPFSSLRKEEVGALFSDGETFVVEPKNILKYRGKRIPEAFPQHVGFVNEQKQRQWHDLTKELKRLILTEKDRGALLEAICKLSASVGGNADIPANLANVFSLGIEEHLQVGPASPDQRRETYILIRGEKAQPIGSGEPSEEFVNHVVMKLLMERADVRDIFEISRSSKRTRFQFIIKLKCNAFDTDQLISEIHYLAAENNVLFGSRTFDLWHHIVQESVLALSHLHLAPYEAHFTKLLRSADPKAFQRMVMKRNQLSKFAKSWDTHRDIIRSIPRALDWLDRFYSEFTFCNFGTVKGDFEQHVEDCIDAWKKLYMLIEEHSANVMREYLNLDDRAGVGEFAKAVQGRYPNEVKQMGDWGEVQKDTLKIFIRFYHRLAGEMPEWVSAHKKTLPQIARPRSYGGHGNNRRKAVDFLKLPDDWDKQFMSVTELLNQMLQMLSDIFELKHPGADEGSNL